jgi:hypothetical protein
MLGEEEVGILDVLRIRPHVCGWGLMNVWMTRKEGGGQRDREVFWMGLLDDQ